MLLSMVPASGAPSGYIYASSVVVFLGKEMQLWGQVSKSWLPNVDVRPLDLGGESLKEAR